MRQSKLFTKTTKNLSKDEKSINSRLLIKAGFLDKLMAGAYSYLPLGFLVFKKIENIIREEMNGVSAQEILLPSMNPRKLWETTNRWRYKEIFKLKNRKGQDYALGWTHEEVVTPLVKKHVHSYKDLPVAVYQIQNKFRDELRTKSGLLRGVEFMMKDLYSFHKDEKDLNKYYEKIKKAYFRIFKRCGIEKETFLTLASGGTFSKYSHEFQTLTLYGEDLIYVCPKCKIAINKEIIEKQKYKCPECNSKKLEIKKTVEVGNIFKLKDKFSQAFDFNFRDKNGKEKKVLMGCYGIGLGRLLGTVVEVCHDDRGIIWPKEISPFPIHLIALGKTKKVKEKAEKIYKDLQKAKVEVLYDNREDKSIGAKFTDSDLIGIPVRIVVSEKTLKNNSFEVKKRNEKKIKLMKLASLEKYVKKYIK